MIKDLMIVTFQWIERPPEDQIFISFLTLSNLSIKFFSCKSLISYEWLTPLALTGSSGHFIPKWMNGPKCPVKKGKSV